FVALDKGANPATVKNRIEASLKDQPYVRVQDATSLKKVARKQIDQILGLLFGLLAMSVLIALFGIINTLALSVFERTREIGLLRAVGTLRGQVTTMVLAEGVLVSVIGALLGMGLGLGLGAAGIYALKSEGVVLHIPLQLVLVLLALGVIAGIIAAALPAWRAARTNVVEAIAGD
ncbi:MAG: FtsX-like permease family protein, partial [Thermoleophilia bacterium]|nr:FtsX-like permease family protein [Thermoleophilia bacterium]